MKIEISKLLVLTVIFALSLFGPVLAESTEDNDFTNKEAFLSTNPFFKYDSINDEILDIYEGTTTDQFVDFYNI